MSKKEKTTSKYLNSIEDKEHKKNKKIEVDRTYIEPQEFQSKKPKKKNQIFFVSRLIYRIGKDDAAGLAAQMTYHFVLALFPMLIFLLTLLGQFITIDANQINQKVSQYVPDQETASIVGGIVKDISDTASGGILSVGLILAIWSASNGMSAIINSFNVAYDVEDSRNGVVVKLLSILYTLVLGAVFVVAVVLITLGPVINKFLFGPLGIIFIIFTVLYSVAPNVKTKLRSVIPGAIFTSIIWLLGSFAFGYYISNFSNYSKTYGSLAGIIILFLWLYITSFIIIIGAEINAIIHQRKVIAGHTPEEAAIKHDDNNENHYNENTTYEYYEDSKDVDISNEDDTYNINHQSKEEHHTSD